MIKTEEKELSQILEVLDSLVDKYTKNKVVIPARDRLKLQKIADKIEILDSTMSENLLTYFHKIGTGT